MGHLSNCRAIITRVRTKRTAATATTTSVTTTGAQTRENKNGMLSKRSNPIIDRETPKRTTTAKRAAILREVAMLRNASILSIPTMTTIDPLANFLEIDTAALANEGWISLIPKEKQMMTPPRSPNDLATKPNIRPFQTDRISRRNTRRLQHFQTGEPSLVPD